MEYTDLTPAEALRLLHAADPPTLLDVRTRPEFDSHRAEGAVLVPVQELAQRIDELPESAAGFVVVCEHGIRSVHACAILADAGYGPLFNVRGGMARWVGEELPHQTGR